MSGWASGDNKVVVPNTDYPFPTNSGTEVACTVTVAVPRSGTTAVTDESTKSAMAGEPVQTTVTVTPDSGGVMVRWTVDPNLVAGVTTAVTLNCTQGGTTLINSAVSGSSKFIETDSTADVACSVSTAVNVPGGSSIDLGATESASATPEESLNTGLPVWLLYQATQP